MSATDTNTDRCNKITITNDKGRFSAEDIKRMSKEAEKYNADDDREKERVSAMNGLESYAFSTKNTMEDDKSNGKVPEENRAKVISKCKEVIEWLDNNQTAGKEEFEFQMKGSEDLLFLKQLN